MILALIGFVLILFGIIQFIRGCYRLLKAAYVRHFASEKQVDKIYEKEILKRSPEYRKFTKNVDKSIQDLLK